MRNESNEEREVLAMFNCLRWTGDIMRETQEKPDISRKVWFGRCLEMRRQARVGVNDLAIIMKISEKR